MLRSGRDFTTLRHDEERSEKSKIKVVRGVWAGKPSDKGTPDANKDYTVALVFVFDNSDALKTYLNDSVHTKFADKQSTRSAG